MKVFVDLFCWHFYEQSLLKTGVKHIVCQINRLCTLMLIGQGIV